MVNITEFTEAECGALLQWLYTGCRYLHILSDPHVVEVETDTWFVAISMWIHFPTETAFIAQMRVYRMGDFFRLSKLRE